MPQNLFDKIQPWFEDAFTRHSGDVDVTWALSLTTLPDPARNNQFVSALTLYSQTPSGVQPGQFLVNTVMMSPGFDRTKVEETVVELMANVKIGLANAKIADSARPQPDLVDLGKLS
jgi:hypothetical protein